MTDMARDESALCLACGLCCQGPLFSWAVLQPDELAHAETLPVVMVDREDALGFRLPCACFRDMHCTVYDERFQVCRDFACQLLLRLRNDQVSQAEALELVRQARELVQEIEDHLPPDEAERVWDRIGKRWDLKDLQPLLVSGQIEPDTLMAIVSLDVHLERHFHHPKVAPDDAP